MSVFMQKLGRLRGAYPAVMLRLGSDSGHHSYRILGTLVKYNRSTTQIDPKRFAQRSAIPNATASVTADEDYDIESPERIPENTYAHNLFLNSAKYASIVMRPSTRYAYVTDKEALEILEQDWDSMTSVETVSAVKKLFYNICHNDGKTIESFNYTRAFDALNVQKLTDDELITIMQHLVPFSSHMEQCKSYNHLCVRIDRECMMRFLRLPREKKLYLCDMIYQMTPKIYKQYYSQFIWFCIRNLCNKPHKLSPEQLIQILFFLNVYRKPPISMYELEFRLEQCMDELSINEIAVAALGFFKTSTKIRNKDFLNRIIQRVIAEIDVMDTVSIGAIIKLVRYSMTLTEVKPLLDLVKVLTPYEPRYTLMSLAHISQACGRVAVYDKELMDRIIRRLNRELKIARLKDFERFFFTFSILNIDSSSSVYQNVIEELRATWDTTRAHEIIKFPQVAARILGYLSVLDIYPTDLIKRVMLPAYVNKTCYGNYRHLSREYLVLNYGLQIEVPEYDGPLLAPTIRDFLEKKYYDLHLKTGSAESTWPNVFISNVLQTCQELFNTTTDILVTRVLPQYTSQDIIFCLDERNQLVPSEKYLSQFESSDIKRVENSNNVRWIALIIAHHGVMIRNCRKPTGPLTAKMRQLSKIGYTPIMISRVSWETTKTPQEKCNYIKRLILR